MSFLRRGLIYGAVSVGAPVMWYKLGLYDVDDIRQKSFNAGAKFSKKFKPYSAWDRIAEPFIIKQSSVLFTAGHSFIEGMASDNENNSIQKHLEQMDNEMIKEIDRKD